MKDPIIGYIILFILFLMLGATILVIVWSIRNGISPMPTSPKAKRCLLRALPKDLKGKIYELGSGWGTLAFPLARRYPDCQVVGFESSPVPYWVSRIRLYFQPLPNLQFKRLDFFLEDIGDASLVVCYLYPEAMKRLREKFQKELLTGTWVISNTFAVPGWEAKEVYRLKDVYFTKIYLYRCPSKNH